jgi:hypothetical protein
MQGSAGLGIMGELSGLIFGVILCSPPCPLKQLH